MEIPFKAVCVDDANKPKIIPIERWVKKGEAYTVTFVVVMPRQKEKIGFRLAELDLEGCFPYDYYAARRFSINQKLIDEVELDKLLKQAIKEEEDGIHITTEKSSNNILHGWAQFFKRAFKR